MTLFLDQRLNAGQTIILDGGTGTEMEKRGAPMSEQSWCAAATLTHQPIIRGIHRDYILAGADVVTANTFGSSVFTLDYHNKLDDLDVIDRTAVELARQAVDEAKVDRPVAVAGSFSVMRPVIIGSDRSMPPDAWTEDKARPLLERKAKGLKRAGVDVIFMEMMRDADHSLWATEAAVATGLPVWVGISVERRTDGVMAGFARHDWALDDIVAPLMATGAKVCSVMHCSVNDVTPALEIIRGHWTGPLGAYPESGFFQMPHWQFVDIIEPTALVEAARPWRELGVSVLGGCCGMGPEHIQALSQAYAGRD
ncbi:MAG: homocysteine S-methyltransferase family protein [Hyphomicrobiaceae bacterium]